MLVTCPPKDQESSHVASDTSEELLCWPMSFCEPHPKHQMVVELVVEVQALRVVFGFFVQLLVSTPTARNSHPSLMTAATFLSHSWELGSRSPQWSSEWVHLLGKLELPDFLLMPMFEIVVTQVLWRGQLSPCRLALEELEIWCREKPLHWLLLFHVDHSQEQQRWWVWHWHPEVLPSYSGTPALPRPPHSHPPLADSSPKLAKELQAMDMTPVVWQAHHPELPRLCNLVHEHHHVELHFEELQQLQLVLPPSRNLELPPSRDLRLEHHTSPPPSWDGPVHESHPPPPWTDLGPESPPAAKPQGQENLLAVVSASNPPPMHQSLLTMGPWQWPPWSILLLLFLDLVLVQKVLPNPHSSHKWIETSASVVVDLVLLQLDIEDNPSCKECDPTWGASTMTPPPSGSKFVVVVVELRGSPWSSDPSKLEPMLLLTWTTP